MVDFVSCPHEQFGGMRQFDQRDETVHRLAGCGKVPSCDATVVEAFQKDVLRCLYYETVAKAARIVHCSGAFSQIMAELAVPGEKLGCHKVCG